MEGCQAMMFHVSKFHVNKFAFQTPLARVSSSKDSTSSLLNEHASPVE